jgi:hypothetical protein
MDIKEQMKAHLDDMRTKIKNLAWARWGDTWQDDLEMWCLHHKKGDGKYVDIQGLDGIDHFTAAWILDELELREECK